MDVKSESRHLTELDLAGFDVKLEQHAALLDARMTAHVARREAQMAWRNATTAFWLIQVATVVVCLGIALLMR